MDTKKGIACIFLILLGILSVFEFFIYYLEKKEQWQFEEFSANVALEYIAENIIYGLHIAAKNEKYFGGLNYIELVNETFSFPVVVLNENKDIVFSTKSFPRHLISKSHDLDGVGFLRLPDQSKLLIKYLFDKNNNLTGYILIYIDSQKINANIQDKFIQDCRIHAPVVVISLLLIFLFLLFLRTKVRYPIVAISILCIFICSFLSIKNTEKEYTSKLYDCINKTSIILSKDFNRLIDRGIDVLQAPELDSYLDAINRCYEKTVSFRLVAYEASSGKGREDEAADAALQTFSYELNQHAGRGYVLQSSIAREPLFSKKLSIVLDTVTLMLTAAILLAECLHSLEQAIAVAQKRAVPQSMVRMVMFVCIFALDMTLAFIPLRMENLLPLDIPNRHMLLGLPISVEMAFSALVLPLAGILFARVKTLGALLLGLLLAMTGSLLAVQAHDPLLFIVSRSIVGAGYSLCLLSAQVVTVEHGLLSDMFAGVYGGSICGVAIGSMLAERLGYTQIFAITAGILVVLAIVLLVTQVRKNSAFALLFAQQPSAAPTVQPSSVLRHIFSKDTLFLMLCVVLPFSLLKCGILEFLVPVILNNNALSQGNIGRIVMFNALIVVVLAPFFSIICTRYGLYRSGVLVSIVLAIASIGVLGLLPPLSACITTSALLGIATAISIPSHSGYLLSLTRAKADTSTAMTSLNFFQRSGDVVGPVAIGTAISAAGVVGASVGMCVVFGAGLLLFCAFSRRNTHRGNKTLKDAA